MSLLVVCFFCGLVGALCGKSKGQPGIGFILGALLGPIGWILSLLSGDVRPKCEACRQVVDPKATVCPHCRSAIVKAQPAIVAVPFSRTEPSLRRTIAPKTAA
jgi:hypothetical protein